MALFLTGVAILAAIVGLFWLKDRLRSPTLSRLAYSEPIARIAIVGAAMAAIGLLSILWGLFSP